MAIEKDWTIMIYMAGDNNLSADMAYALADIREVMKGKGDKLNLMVYYDGAAIDAPSLYCDFTDFDKPVYCPTGSVKKAFTYQRKRPDSSETDENSGAVYTLMNFVNWCVNDTTVSLYRNGETFTQTHIGKKAKKHALIFSGHASAFQNMSLMVDSSSDYYMTIPKLRWALEQITKKEKPFYRETSLLQQKIDLLGFDSCVMGMAELAYEFSGVAKTMVASEGNLPSAGWSYGSILSELILPDSAAAETDEKVVAQGFVEKFIERQNEFLIGGISVDIAALDLSEDKIGAVIKYLNELGKNLFDILHSGDSELAEKMEHTLLISHLECQSYMFEQNVDLKDFCEILSKNLSNYRSQLPEFFETCKNLIQAIDDCVLMCGFSGGAYQYSNGISAFFPWTSRSYYSSKENYEKLMVLNDPNPLKDWNEFLRSFTYLTIRGTRWSTNAAAKPGETAGYEFYFPSKSNGVANDRNSFSGRYSDNNSADNKNTHIANDKNTHIANDKNTHIANDKNTHIANDKNTHIANDKNTHIANDKNTHIANDKNTHIANDKNTHIANDRNTHIANDKNTHIANDKGLQQYLMTQFKNIITRWNVSGFTKLPGSRKSEVVPEVVPEAESE